MREIKFRVWHPPITDGEVTLAGHMDYELVHHKMLQVRTETRMPPEHFGFDHIQSGLYFINDDLAEYGDRLMQYTGLKDKNGKEIYEGDIVKYKDENCEKCGISHKKSAEVIWHEMGFWALSGGLGQLSVNRSNIEKGSIIEQFNYLEIIGNIYENPELLNKDK